MIAALLSCPGVLTDGASAKMNLLYTTENNLPSSLVNQVEEDTNEMIWVATEDGLCRFDGSQFVTYGSNPKDPHSLQSNIVQIICTDEAGHVLVGTKAGVQMYRPATDDFTRVICDTLQGIHPGNISDLTLLSDGDFIVSGRVIFTIHIDEHGEPHALPNVLTASLRTSMRCCEDFSGNLWTTSSVHGVHRLEKDGKLEQIPMGGDVKGISMLMAGPDGVMYMAGVDRGLYKYNNVSRQIEEVTRPGDNFRISELDRVPGKQQIYVCTDGEGVKILDCPTGKMTNFVFDDVLMEAETQKVHSMTTSRSGDVWMAIYQKGLLAITRNQFDFHYYGPNSVRYNSIGDRCVTAMLRTSDGLLWAGTDNGGVYALDDEGQTVTFHPCGTGPHSIPSALATLFEDSRHRVWFGSYGQGGGMVDLSSGVCQYVPLENQRSNTSNICAYAEDCRQRLWVASMGNGILQYDEAHETFVRQNLISACNWAGALLYNAMSDQLFAGTYNGLVVISNLDGEMKCEQYYSHLVVYSISLISATQISLSTNAGLIVFDVPKRQGRSYTVQDGLISDNIYASQPDDEGNLWMSTSRSISKLNLRQHTITNYTSRDGFQFNEFFKNTSMRDADGTLWFGGTKGINWFNPNHIRKREMAVEGRVVRFNADQRIVMPDTAGVYHLEEDERTFSVELATRPITQTFSVTYRYAMDHDAWQTLPPAANRVTFSRIMPGRHTFHFQIDADGTLLPIEDVQIIIAKPWFMQWWMLVLYVVLFCLLLWLINQYLHRRYIEQRMRLKHAEEVADKEEKLQFFMNIAHEIRTPMTLVMSPLQKLMNNDKDPERQRSYQLIDRNANRVLGLINEIMDIRKFDKAQMQLQCQRLQPARLIQDLCEAVSDLAQERQIELTCNTRLPEDFLTWIDKGCFEKIVINLLSNAIKYTPRGGQITVESMLTPEGKLNVSVADTGIGIDPADRTHVFDLFYRSKASKIQTIGTGIGLHLVKALVTLHHGDIEVKDNQGGHGTVLSFTLPVSDDDYREEEKIARLPRTEEFGDELDEVTIVKKSVGTAMEEGVADGSRSSRRIMVVDDEDDIRQYLASELRTMYRVTTCLNGREALEQLLADADSYDLVVSDVMMPEMDGVELCRYIRSNVLLNHLPVVLLTAKTSDEDRLKSLKVGANAFISKPFNMEILFMTIKNLIDEHDRLRSSFSGLQLPADKVDTPELQSPDQRLLQRVLKVVNDNLSNPELTTEMIADKVGLSRVHLYRKLKELTNQSARNYIRNIRLAKAAELLTQRKMSIAEVAYEVGFTSPNNFATAFKELYGMTPTAYNEKHYRGAGPQS